MRGQKDGFVFVHGRRDLYSRTQPSPDWSPQACREPGLPRALHSPWEEYRLSCYAMSIDTTRFFGLGVDFPALLLSKPSLPGVDLD